MLLWPLLFELVVELKLIFGLLFSLLFILLKWCSRMLLLSLLIWLPWLDSELSYSRHSLDLKRWPVG